jgi:hypothetical protein
MPRMKYAFISLTVTVLLGVTAPAMAASRAALPLNWQQNNISWNQLQTIFNQNPNINQFTIHFPNGTNWNINATEMEGIYNNYLQKALPMAGNGPLPTLMFSALNSKTTNAHGVTTIPVRNALDNMQLATRNMLDEINYEKYHLAEYLPDWLKKMITLIFSGFSQMWDFAVTQIKKWF